MGARPKVRQVVRTMIHGNVLHTRLSVYDSTSLPGSRQMGMAMLMILGMCQSRERACAMCATQIHVLGQAAAGSLSGRALF